jgi:hypothetical protein
LDLRPVFRRLEERVKAHVLICMLTAYLTWHSPAPGVGAAHLHRPEPALSRTTRSRRRSAHATVLILAEPSADQRQAFDLIGDPPRSP